MSQQLTAVDIKYLGLGQGSSTLSKATVLQMKSCLNGIFQFLAYIFSIYHI